ncbi:MAG: hypothetical protein WB608_02035 [Terracidiphilus sp.]
MIQPKTSVLISDSPLSAKSESTTSKKQWEEWLEITATLLLACATVGSAWSAYQSKRWGGVQMFNMAAANRAQSDAVRLSNKASQLTSIDINVFLQWANAVSSHQKQFADFILQRFRPEMKVAVDAWIATRPLKNPNAPASPFAMKEYSLSAQRQADQMSQLALQKLNEAKAANAHADDYVMLTVLFASALFFGGIGTKMKLRILRVILLSLGIAVFAVTAALLIWMPIAHELN